MNNLKKEKDDKNSERKKGRKEGEERFTTFAIWSTESGGLLQRVCYEIMLAV